MCIVDVFNSNTVGVVPFDIMLMVAPKLGYGMTILQQDQIDEANVDTSSYVESSSQLIQALKA